MKTNVRFLFTSRFILEVTEKFQSDPILKIRASKNDVKRFIVGQIPRLLKYIRRDDELALIIQSKIIKAIDNI